MERNDEHRKGKLLTYIKLDFTCNVWMIENNALQQKVIDRNDEEETEKHAM